MKERASKRGYLKEPYKIFYLKEKPCVEIHQHAHDFNKLILFLQGNVVYRIEGQAYQLEAGDIVVVNDEDVHYPEIDGSVYYERVVIWIKTDYLKSASSIQTDMEKIFESVKEKKVHLLRPVMPLKETIEYITNSFVYWNTREGYGQDLMQEALLIQLLVMLPMLMEQKSACVSPSTDPRVQSVIDYIGEHIAEPLDIAELAKWVHVSRYRLMHLFKECTGITIYQYIIRKRVNHANRLVKMGKTLTQAAQESGFNEYSSFGRAFEKYYNCSPAEYHGKRKLRQSNFTRY